LFGFVGDYRSGSSDLIRKWAQPTDNYPDWLPSGMLWGYIYGATPINNLLRTVDVSPPLNNLLFPNTAATLFPSVLRAMIYGEQLGETESGQLVDSTFNVSTAYVGPYQDFGFIGVAIYSMLTAFLCLQFCQCLILSLFWNQFLALPVITQVFWLGFFFRRKSTSKRRVRTSYHTFLNRGAIR
jgi:hypothetical protein